MKRFLATALFIVTVIAIAGIVLHSSASHNPLQQRASKVLVLKAQHRLLLLDDSGNVIRSYRIAIGRGGLELKQRQCDHKSPKGSYVIDGHKRDSRFHRALHVSYPNDFDRAHARKLGVDPGGDIMIHGFQNGLNWIGPQHRAVDWTDGGIAATDNEIEEIYSAVPGGMPVEIRP